MKLVSYLHITILLSLLALISSCTDEDIVKSYNIKEGVPVTVSLKYNVAQSTVETRSAQDATVEQTVQRLFVIAFKQNGDISGKTYPDLPDAKVLAGLDSAYQEWKKGLSRSDVSGRFREGLANVIHLLPQVDFVLLDSNSRLMRPKRLTHVESYIKEYFCRYDVKLHVVKSGIIDFSTFTGSFMTSVEGQINDEQISSQLTNSRAALKKLKDEGFFNSGGDRLGYKFLRKHRYEIVPEEAELIRFARMGQGERVALGGLTW